MSIEWNVECTNPCGDSVFVIEKETSLILVYSSKNATISVFSIIGKHIYDFDTELTLGVTTVTIWNDIIIAGGVDGPIYGYELSRIMNNMNSNMNSNNASNNNNVSDEQPIKKLEHAFKLEGHFDSVRCMSLCESYLISAGCDFQIILWDLMKLKHVTNLYASPSSVRGNEALANDISFEKDYLFIGHTDGAVCSWNNDNYKLVVGNLNHTGMEIHSLKTTVQYLICSGKDIHKNHNNIIKIWKDKGKLMEPSYEIVESAYIRSLELFSGVFKGTAIAFALIAPKEIHVFEIEGDRTLARAEVVVSSEQNEDVREKQEKGEDEIKINQVISTFVYHDSKVITLSTNNGECHDDNTLSNTIGRNASDNMPVISYMSFDVLLSHWTK